MVASFEFKSIHKTISKMKDYILNFDGYWRECNKNGLPTYPGIYLVYRSRYNPQNDTVSLVEIIYIGKTDNIHDRLIKHEKYDLFVSQLREHEELCYSCAEVVEDIELVENALIFVQKPALNDQGKDSYNYSRAHFVLDGSCTRMKYTNFNIG